MIEGSKIEQIPKQETSVDLSKERAEKLKKTNQRAQGMLVGMEQKEEDKFSIDVIKTVIDFLGKSIKKNQMDTKDFNILLDNLKKQYPDNSSEINTLFDTIKVYTFPKGLKRKVGGFMTTEYYTRLTDFIYKNKDKVDRMKKFWDRKKIIFSILSARKSKISKEKRFIIEKVGMVGQAAGLHVLDRLGFGVNLATPEEDAYEATDLWMFVPTGPSGDEDFHVVEMGLPIQVKSSKNVMKLRKLKIREDDAIHYPAMQISSEKLPADKDVFISTESIESIPHIAEKVETKEKRTGRKVSALRIEIPHQEIFIDLNTGVPTQKCIEDAKKEFEKLFQQ